MLLIIHKSLRGKKCKMWFAFKDDNKNELLYLHKVNILAYRTIKPLYSSLLSKKLWILQSKIKQKYLLRCLLKKLNLTGCKQQVSNVIPSYSKYLVDMFSTNIVFQGEIPY